MFHHRFVKQQEALGFSLIFLSIGLLKALLLPLLRCFTVLQRLFLCLFLFASPFFRGFPLPLFLLFYRSSEAFIYSSFFVYFVYERLVVVGQQGEPIVAACLKSHMGGAQEGRFCHGHLFDLGNVDDQWV